MPLRRFLLLGVFQWLPLAVNIGLLSCVVYAAVRQNYRSNANDPQMQMVVDARNALNHGASPASLVPSQQLDIATRLSPYLTIFDSSGSLLSASATLHGQPIAPPSGEFASAKAESIDTVTWMPEPGIRSAIVVVPWSGGFIVAGRSLTQVELRESDLELLVGIFCVGALAVSLFTVLVTRAVQDHLTRAAAVAR